MLKRLKHDLVLLKSNQHLISKSHIRVPLRETQYLKKNPPTLSSSVPNS